MILMAQAEAQFQRMMEEAAIAQATPVGVDEEERLGHIDNTKLQKQRRRCIMIACSILVVVAVIATVMVTSILSFTATQPADIVELDPQSSYCETTRCGHTWVTANSNCGPNCVLSLCTEDGHTCFANLANNLDCCQQESDSDVSESVPAAAPESNVSSPSSCTTARCGLTWVTANSNCGPNCVDNGDCTEEGHTCFADLANDLDCCA
jgi:hypothetical protein